MPLRDILVTLVVFGLLPFILRQPRVGIFAWSWISYMNPHRLAWGFAYSMPFAMIVGVATLIGALFYRGPKSLPMNGVTIWWILLVVWMAFTTLFAFTPYAWVMLENVVKIQLFALLTIVLIRSKKDLDILIWVIVLSIGFFSFKGGVFTLQTAGEFRVWGPPRTYIEDNNSLSVATFMILPLMYYLRTQTTNTWVRHGLLLIMLFSVVSAIGSHSRSGLVAAGATAFFLWLKTPGKIVSAIAIIIVAAGIFAFMPEAWHDRMDTIANYEEDASAMNRLYAWELARNLASDRVVGGGFGFWGPDYYHVYSSVPADWTKKTAAHSIYFTMVGEHGWPGLILFLAVFLSTWRLASRLIRQCRHIPELKWQKDLLQLLQVSLVAYASGGAFLNLSYYDLPWHLVSIVVICKVIQDQYRAENPAVSGQPVGHPRGYQERFGRPGLIYKSR